MTKKLGITSMTEEELTRRADEAMGQFKASMQSKFVGLANVSVLVFYGSKTDKGREYLQRLFVTHGITGKQKETGCLYRNSVMSCMKVKPKEQSSTVTKYTGALKAVAKYRSENPSLFINTTEQEQIDLIADYIEKKTIEKLYLSMSESRCGLSYEEHVKRGFKTLDEIKTPLAVAASRKISSTSDFVVMIGRMEDDKTTSVLEYIDSAEMVAYFMHKIGKKEAKND